MSRFAEVHMTPHGRRERPGFVATTTTAIEDSDGGIQRIVAGVTHVHSDCDLLNMHPNLFVIETAVSKTGQRRARPLTPTSPEPRHDAPHLHRVPNRRPADTELPRVRGALPCGRGLRAVGDVELRQTTPSPVTVYISRGTRDQISREARAVPVGFESGGLLIARRSFSDVHVHLHQAWGPGPSAHLGRHSMVVDWEQEHFRARCLARETDNKLIAAGFWHIHPGGSDRPSQTDLQMFAAALADATETVWPLRFYTALIATNMKRRRGPDLSAWVVRRQPWGALVCERAAVGA